MEQGPGAMAHSLKYRRYRSRRPSAHAVTELRAERNYTLWLRFDDGLEGHVYLGDLITTQTFGVLSDEEKFRRAAIDPVSNAVTWEGEIEVSRDGPVQVQLKSDDGSRMTIGKHLVPCNQAPMELKLRPGTHPVKLEYGQAGGNWSLAVDLSGPAEWRTAAEADKLSRSVIDQQAEALETDLAAGTGVSPVPADAALWALRRQYLARQGAALRARARVARRGAG